MEKLQKALLVCGVGAVLVFILVKFVGPAFDKETKLNIKSLDMAAGQKLYAKTVAELQLDAARLDADWMSDLDTTAIYMAADSNYYNAIGLLEPLKTLIDSAMYHDYAITYRQKLSAVEQNFVKHVDEFTERTWYHHKLWGKRWPSYTTLYAYVSSSGKCFVRSVYKADSWLFHDEISVKSGDYVVKFRAKSDTRDAVRGGVYEVNDYGLTDSEIILSTIDIAKGPIKCRYHGSDFIHDFTLGPKSKAAMIDCFELSQLLKQKRGRPLNKEQLRAAALARDRLLVSAKVEFLQM